ncbi:Pc04g00180 [Penicillium rubens Wisconsin 54-1255]|uniref:Pc04g00180 protein n=2 Tax=Penicillium chrysogenum species complex TaxID=254878 RepID=B6GVU4_PENRW|nr:Pc04g00180 [Penicillium rubens Wisconsin 54-1255]
MSFSRQSEVEHWEQKLYDYRESHFELSARVHISHLFFESGFRRRMDGRQNIRRLTQLMKMQGCQRLMRDNHVPVLVPRAHWQDRVRPRSGGGIIPSLDMELDYRLCAYDHENLITAARNFLDHDNQWWIVDVYLTDNEEGAFAQFQLSEIVVDKFIVSPDDHRNETESIRHKFIQSLKERYPNDNRPPDGLIYERINRYEGYLDTPRDPLAANNWWAVLEALAGSKKGKYLKQFFKHETLHQKLNSLLIIPGLWGGMRIGLLHKLTAMHCDEPVACYWELIFSTFSRLVGGREELLLLIDGVTVELLQSRVPKISRKDLQSLQVELEEGRLFPNFSEEARQDIWARLKEIDYPIPTLKTFFKDRLYLEVAQSVMKRLFVQPRGDKITIDQGVYGKYDTPVPVSMALRQEWLGSDLLEFWRFSFQYGFEMTDHQRLKWPTDADPEDMLDRRSSGSSFLPKQEIWRHFFTLVRARGFQAPVTDDTSFATGELPSPRVCEFPEDLAEEIEVAKRCGKPYSNTVEADRFALSAETLRQSQASVRVTAGFLRQSVFKAFFGYLWNSNSQMAGGDPPDDNIEVHHRGERPTTANVGRAMMATDGMDVDPGSLRPNPLVTSAARTHNAAATASPADILPPFGVMTFTVGRTTRILDLPIHDSFMKDFSTGLFNNNFNVQTDEREKRSISPYTCYSHYLHNPSSVLHAEFRQNEHTTYAIAPSQIGAGSKRRMLDEDEQMARAEIWLQEQIALLSDRRNGDEDL